MYEFRTNYSGRRRGRTLNIERRALTVPKAALAGAMLEISFARSRALMVASNAEMMPSRSFGCWELVSMVEARGSWEKIVRQEGCAERPENGRQSLPSFFGKKKGKNLLSCRCDHPISPRPAHARRNLQTPMLPLFELSNRRMTALLRGDEKSTSFATHSGASSPSKMPFLRLRIRGRFHPDHRR